jgi:hypothetical protein
MHRKNRFYLLILQTQHMKFHFCNHRAQNSSETKHISKENIQGLDGRCRLRVIGQIDRKYILCISTFDNLLIVVDQHAGCFVLLLHLVFLFSHFLNFCSWRETQNGRDPKKHSLTLGLRVGLSTENNPCVIESACSTATPQIISAALGIQSFLKA